MDEIFLPFLSSVFASYLQASRLSRQEATEEGSDAFLAWLQAEFPDSPDDIRDKEEYNEEAQGPTEEGLFILSSFLFSDPSGSWLQEYWADILLAGRSKPKHPIAEIHASYFVRWADDKVFSFTCLLPANLFIPKGHLSDYLVAKIGRMSAEQFQDTIAARSLDGIHEAQQVTLPKENIEELFRRLVAVISEEPDADKRSELQEVIKVLRSLSLPFIPLGSERAARESITGTKLTGGNWAIFPLDDEQ